MSLKVYFLVIITAAVINQVSNHHYTTEEIENNVNLIKDLQTFFRIPSVVVIHNDQENPHLLIYLLKQISQTQSYSIAVSQSNFIINHSQLLKTSKILFVVLINDEEEFADFASFARNKRLFFHIWLLLFSDSKIPMCRSPRDNWLGLDIGVEILVKCGNETEIKEWFATGSRHSTQVHEFLEWSSETGLIVKRHPVLFERRRNLSGVVSRVAYIDESTVIQNNNSSSLTSYRGYEVAPTIVEEIAPILNITLEFQNPSNAYGTHEQATGRWTGLLGRLWNQTIDIAAANLGMASFRHIYFDFTYPIISTHLSLFIKKPDGSEVPWDLYLKVFNKSVWFILASTIIVSLIFLTVMKIVLDGIHKIRHIFIENCMCIWRIYCQQGLADYTNSPSLKFAYLSIFLSAFVLISIYSGSLTSYVTVKIPHMPFRSVAEFANDESYKLTVINSMKKEMSFYIDNGTVKISHLIKQEKDLPLNLVAGLNQVCNERVAFLTVAVLGSKLTRQINCELASVATDSKISGAIALRKNDPLTKFFNHYLQRLRENGALHRVKINPDDKEQFLPQQLFEACDLEKITPLLAILICGFLTSAFVFLCEISIQYVQVLFDKPY